MELWRYHQELKAQAKEKKGRKEVMTAALDRSRHRQQQQPTYTRSNLHPLYEENDEDIKEQELEGTAQASTSTAQAQAEFPFRTPRKGVLPPFLLWQEEQRRRMARLEQEGAERGGAEGEEEEEEGEGEEGEEVKDTKDIDLEAAELEMEILPLDTASYSGSEGGRVEDDDVDEEEGEAQRETERRRQAKEARLPFFTRVCMGASVKFLIAYGVGLGVAVVIAKFVEMHVGLVLLSLLPAIGLLTHFQRLYHKSVLRREILMTFLLTVILLAPLVLLENFFSFAAVIQTRIASEAEKNGGREWGYRVLFGFVQSYLVAGLFEEAIKYLAVRRLFSLSYALDPRAIVTYGLTAGCSFGTIEDLFLYAFKYGLTTTVARALLSVPLHGLTGLLMGCSIAQAKLSHPSLPPSLLRSLGPPLLIHGTFDLCFFLLGDILPYLALGLQTFIVLAAGVYARRWFLRLLLLAPEEGDIHALIEEDERKAQRAKMELDMSTTSWRSWRQDELDEKHRILPPALRSMVMTGVVGAICLTGMMSFFQFW